MAYVLGYFAADGTMIQNSRGGQYVEFTSTDIELLEHVHRIGGCTQHISLRKPREGKDWKTQYRLQVGSRDWFGDLERLGFSPKKSRTMRLPDIPTKHHAAFVRGYFDGDGCVYFKLLKFADRARKRWILMTIFTCGSRPFLEDLLKILKDHGVRGGSLRTKERGHDISFSHKDSLAIYNLMYHTGSDTGPYLTRKRRVFDRAIQILYPKLRL
jgi:hypothetical protein